LIIVKNLSDQQLVTLDELIEKIQNNPGFGYVVIIIQNGHPRFIMPAPSLDFERGNHEQDHGQEWNQYPPERKS